MTEEENFSSHADLSDRVQQLEQMLDSYQHLQRMQVSSAIETRSKSTIELLLGATGTSPTGGLFPRVLILDASPAGSLSATGQLLSTLFRGWQPDAMMQVSAVQNKQLVVHGGLADVEGAERSLAETVESVRNFAPEVIWFRPDARSVPLLQVYEAVGAGQVPMCLHVVDDWVARHETVKDSEAYHWEQALVRLADEAVLRFAISPEMAAALTAEHGQPFDVVSNVVDLDEFPYIPQREDPDVLRFHFAGQLANNKGGDSFMQLAAALEARANGDVALHARTAQDGHDWWYVQALKNFGHFSSSAPTESKLDYYQYLTSADISILAFNFDAATSRYLEHSFANRMPELLAAGRPILAIGPPDLASIRFIRETGVGITVERAEIPACDWALRYLRENPEERLERGDRAREVASWFDAAKIRPSFHAKLAGAAQLIPQGILDTDKLNELAGPTDPRHHTPPNVGASTKLESRPSDADLEKMRSMHNRHDGERCVIIGNGPSLNNTDLSLLDGEYVFGSNGIYLLFDEVNWRPQYYGSVDSRFLPDRADDVAQLLRDYPEMTGFFPSTLELHDGSGVNLSTADLLPDLDNRVLFWSTHRMPQDTSTGAFSMDATRGMIQPSTVTVTLMQMAAHLGFKEMVLIGCDTSYSIPKTVEMSGPVAPGQTEERMLLKSTADDDPNHFRPDYFGKDREWHHPKVEFMIRHYEQAKEILDANGVRVVNSTVGGELEVFERIELAVAVR